MHILKVPFLLIITAFAFLLSCKTSPDYVKGEAVATDVIARDYLPAVRIVWLSDTTGQKIENAGRLLIPGNSQADLFNDGLCRMVNDENHRAAILLDFGRELHGGLEIVGGRWPGGKPLRIRVRFGESVSEAMAEPGGEKNATNDHAIRDEELLLPWLGKKEIGNTGFRFVRIDFLEPEGELFLKEVNAISVYRDIPWLGSFSCSDTLLNRIWQTGAYTVHLNMQEFLWDGIKRDRLVWVGDLHPEVMTIGAVFGQNEVVRKSMDLIRDKTPLPGWMNGISSYSMWWVLIHAQLYRQNGDLAYLTEQKDYLTALLNQLIGKIGEDGLEKLDGHRFLDWPSSENQPAIHAGYQAMLAMTLTEGAELCRVIGNPALEAGCLEGAGKLKRNVPDMSQSKQAAALLSLAGLIPAKKAVDEVIAVGGPKNFSTFYGYYMLQALAQAGEYGLAMDIIKDYWGGMLKLGATTFWEDFNLDWAENAYGIDQLPVDGKDDIHGDFGDYCYVGLRHSLCHGWASGPTAWMSEHILGIKIMEPGCRKVAIEPNLGNLEWAEGTYPTPHGTIFIRHDKQQNGSVKSVIKAPKGVSIVRKRS
jgi:alpha-L-rhamnosidase